MVLGTFVFINGRLIQFNEKPRIEWKMGENNDIDVLDRLLFFVPSNYMTGWHFYQKFYILATMAFLGAEFTRLFGWNGFIFILARIGDIIGMIWSTIYANLNQCYRKLCKKSTSQLHLEMAEKQRKDVQDEDDDDLSDQDGKESGLKHLEGGDEEGE
jgi:hypothetical protein